MKSLPAQLVSAAHETYGARAVVYALLLDHEAEPRQRQLMHLEGAADPGVYEETLRLIPIVQQLDMRARLPLLDMSLPALRGLVRAQYELFKQNVAALVQADNAIDLFEWSLHRILLHDLEAHFVRRSPPGFGTATLASVRSHSELLLSMLAYAGHRDLESAQHGFEQAKRTLGLPKARLHPVDDLQFSGARHRACSGGGGGAKGQASAAAGGRRVHRRRPRGDRHRSGIAQGDVGVDRLPDAAAAADLTISSIRVQDPRKKRHSGPKTREERRD